MTQDLHHASCVERRLTQAFCTKAQPIQELGTLCYSEKNSRIPLCCQKLPVFLQGTDSPLQDRVGMRLDPFKVILISGIPDCLGCHYPPFQVRSRQFVHQNSKELEKIAQVILALLDSTTALCPQQVSYCLRLAENFAMWIHLYSPPMQIFPGWQKK